MPWGDRLGDSTAITSCTTWERRRSPTANVRCGTLQMLDCRARGPRSPTSCPRSRSGGAVMGLLSEAVFVTALLALSLVVLFVTAAGLTGSFSALVVTVLTLFASTKLYAYPKVLVFSVAVALFLRYARNPTGRHVALLAMWSAVAFLFRHDFLVYLAASATSLGSRPRFSATDGQAPCDVRCCADIVTGWSVVFGSSLCGPEVLTLRQVWS